MVDVVDFAELRIGEVIMYVYALKRWQVKMGNGIEDIEPPRAQDVHASRLRRLSGYPERALLRFVEVELAVYFKFDQFW